VTLVANSVYACVSGGAQSDVAPALWTKKAPGCAWNGNTTVTVYDNNSGYSPPYPSYTVKYQTPTPLQFLFAINIINGPLVPSNATTLVQNAIISAFGGGDGGPRARIGSTVLATRFYAPVAALGPWAQIYSLLIGSNNTPAATFTASIATSTMSVSAVASGTIAIGQTISDATGNLIVGTTSTSGSGSSWTVSNSQTVGSETMVSAVAASQSVVVQINQVPALVAANIKVNFV
jgi:hypothetical protein